MDNYTMIYLYEEYQTNILRRIDDADELGRKILEYIERYDTIELCFEHIDEITKNFIENSLGRLYVTILPRILDNKLKYTCLSKYHLKMIKDSINSSKRAYYRTHPHKSIFDKKEGENKCSK